MIDLINEHRKYYGLLSLYKRRNNNDASNIYRKNIIAELKETVAQLTKGLYFSFKAGAQYKNM